MNTSDVVAALDMDPIYIPIWEYVKRLSGAAWAKDSQLTLKCENREEMMLRIRHGLLSMVFLMGCSKGILTKVSLLQAAGETPRHQLVFRFHKGTDTSIHYGVDRIEIHVNQEPKWLLEGTKQTHRYVFPEIPESFRLTPRSDDEMKLDSGKNYQFYFSGRNTISSHGFWEFKAIYLDSLGNWVFDKHGNFRPLVEAYYENWVGRDFIFLKFSHNLTFDESHLALYDSSGKAVEFKLIHRGMPRSKFALELLQDRQAHDKLRLMVSSRLFKDGERREQETRYPVEIRVGNKSSIGFGARYNQLYD